MLNLHRHCDQLSVLAVLRRRRLGSLALAVADAAFGVGVAQYLIGQGVDVIFGAGGPTGSSGIVYAAAPTGTAISFSGGPFSATGVFQRGRRPGVRGWRRQGRVVHHLPERCYSGL